MNDLLPILKNRKELDAQKGRGMFVDELFGNENCPILMYGEDKGEYMTYTQSKNNEEDKQIKEQAIKNLEKLDVHFKVQDMQGYKIAIVQHEYAAEKIMDKNFMKNIASDLGTNSIVVGIPMKGFMAVVAKGKGEANLYGAIVNQYKNAQTYPISNSLFYVVDGVIEMIGGDNLSGAVKDDNGLVEITGKNDKNGKVGFVANVGNKNEDELANQIQTAFQNIILHGIKDSKNFNGKINFHISTRFNQQTPSLDERIKKMAKNISERGAVQIMGGISGEEFKVRFYYGEDQLIAETTETNQLTNKGNNLKSNSETQKINQIVPSQSEKKPWWKFW